MILAAMKLLLKEPNALFDDMTKKLLDYPELKQMIQNMLFDGVAYPFKRENPVMELEIIILKREQETIRGQM